MKFCLFKLGMYCTSIALSGKLLRIKTCLRLNSFSICCASLSPLNWFPVFAVEGFTFFRSTPGCRMKCEQCSLLYRRGWTTLECGNFIIASRTYTLVFVRILLGMSISSLCSPLGLNPARQGSLNYFDSPSNQPSWLNLLSTKESNIRNSE